MAHQFLPHQQAHPAQMPAPHQNIGQQRQAPMTQQQQGPAMGQPQRGLQNPNSLQASYAKYDPQFALFTFERQKGDEGWESIEAEQQHVNTQDLQSDVRKFQKAKNNVKRVMGDIPSSNARRLINELVEEQNQELMAINRTIQWSIASIEIKWKQINRSKKQLQRISVILQTGRSGYEDLQSVRAAGPMGAKAQPMHQGPGFAQQPAHVGHEMHQPQRNIQQPPPPPPMGHMQQPAQQMRPPQSHAQPQHGQAPPPPPPPPPPGMGRPPPPPPGAPLSHLPPPPPGAAHAMPHQPGHGQQQHRPMPGAFPQAAHRPVMRQGQPPIEILDPSTYKKQKKHKGHHEVSSSSSESESESDSDEWDTESGDSAPDRFRVRNVEHGEFAHIGKPKRGRSRQSSRSKKSPHNKSHGKARSRSRSHVRTEHRRRRVSDHIEPPPMGRHSPMSSKDNSPRSSKQQLPPIHIHMNAPAAEKSPRANDRIRRDSSGVSSPDYRKHKFGAQPMSREGSWDRHSGTASINDNSSIHTADDSVFSEPEHRRTMHRSDFIEQPRFKSRDLPPRQQNFGYPHSANIYGDVDTRAKRTAYPTPNDFPQRRDSYFDDTYTPRPSIHRHNSIQTPQSNPFDTAKFSPRLPRSSTFQSDMREPMYPQRESRYISDRPMQDRLQFDELQDAIDRIREEKMRPLHGHTRRASEYERGYGGDYMYDRRC